MHCSFIFQGCDTTSSFHGKGKATALKIARSKDDHVSCFANLGTTISPSSELIAQLSKFVCHLYGHECQSDVNLVRYLAFKDGKFEEESLPPNQDSLALHIYRAAYQCYIWRNATRPILDLPDFTEHGWKIDDDGQLGIKWMSLQPAPNALLLLVNCKCTKGCKNNRCSCRKSGLKCTDVCKCHECKNGKDSADDSDDSDDDMFDRNDQCSSDTDSNDGDNA